MHPADSHDAITVSGARVNNLDSVSLSLPKRRLTVVTGVSGSGKSSLVFGTIAAESQRLINETYSAFLQGLMPNLDRPDVDALGGLTTAIAVDQEPMGANPRSTVGTATDALAYLRVLYSRLAKPHIGGPGAYSFNVASVSAAGAMTVKRGDAPRATKTTYTRTGGMCPRCEGMGSVTDLDLAELFDETRSLNDGALTVPGYTAGGWNHRLYAESGLVDPDRPIRDYTDRQRHDLLYKEATRMKIAGINMTYEGLIPRLRGSMLAKDRAAMQPHIRAFVDRAVTYRTCPDCHGTRLAEAARTSLIAGRSIGDLAAMQLTDLADWIAALDAPQAAPLLAALGELLAAFREIGLGYLSLDRPTATLSGGEAQRTKMVRHLGSALTDVTYVFDEPTAGLHPADIEALSALLLRLRDHGSTVLVVEHRPEIIAAADHCVELGPGAGPDGGRICFEGTPERLAASDTPTGRSLHTAVRLKDRVRTPQGAIEVRAARAHNLADVDVDLPLGALVAVTGVAGSGKSSLIAEALAGPARGRAELLDQSPLTGSRRSNPATYTGLLEPLRKAFAKANGVKAALFSANSEGACPVCGGAGVVVTDLALMSQVATVCEECEGLRYRPEVLAYELGGLSIAQVLALPAAEALAWARDLAPGVPAAVRILERLVRVGLGYVRVGQPLNSLSGGERQRLRLAVQLASDAAVLILDEPTSGLHLADIGGLLALLDDLVDAGRSVIVVEHHQAVIAHADWVIDLGPGAGAAGGRVVFEGTPAELAAVGAGAQAAPTARHLARALAGDQWGGGQWGDGQWGAP